MHSLETIIKKNNDEIIRISGEWHSSYYVVKVYEGLHLVDAAKFDTLEQAQTYAKATNNPLTGTSPTIHCPIL